MRRPRARGGGVPAGPRPPTPLSSRHAVPLRVWPRAPLPNQRRPAAVTPAPPLLYWLALPWYEGASSNQRPASPPSDGSSDLIGEGAGQRRPGPTFG